MPADHSLQLRKAIVDALKGAAGVSALVGDRVYGPEPPSKPVWPFIRYGLPIVEPFEALCWSGSDHDVTVHAFTKGPGEDACAALASAVATALDDALIPMSGAKPIAIDWTGTQILRDTEEASAYHAIITFDCQTVELAA